MEEDLHSISVRGAEAAQFLANPLFREAFDGVADSLRQVALSCDPDNKEKAQRVVISLQLLEAVKREVTRKVEEGEFARFQMKELERQNGVLRRVFSR